MSWRVGGGRGLPSQTQFSMGPSDETHFVTEFFMGPSDKHVRH